MIRSFNASITNRNVAAILIVGTVVSLLGCEAMSHAQQKALIGAGLGGGMAYITAKKLCKEGDNACINRITASGVVIGGVAGYVIGQEQDLNIARELQAKLQAEGHKIAIETVEQDVMVPHNRNTGLSIPNAEVEKTPQEIVIMKPKRVTAMKAIKVTPKDPGNAQERVRLSRELVDAANKMSGKTVLTVPAPRSEVERREIAQLAKDKNMVILQKKNEKSITLAAL